MIIREEAFPFAGPLAVAAVAAGVIGHPIAGGVFLLLALAVCAFFRDPERTSPAPADSILSPADGRVIKVADAGEGRVLVSVFMSVFNVHVNRAPCDGTTARMIYNPGKFMAAWADKASLDNEQMRIEFSTPRGSVRVVQIAGLIARRIVCWAAVGRHFERGERIGLIRFGSRVDVYLPAEAVEVLAAPGLTTKAGVTPLARWRGVS